MPWASSAGKIGVDGSLTINELPKQKQRFVVEMLETMLAQANANA